ncbi:MAG: pimeloyl-CoA dehydrogenase large subunit [Sphingobium sp.]|nr:MAG: pimeloyl-CoA dehydrogenase large subunit [Sphingobium sp.]
MAYQYTRQDLAFAEEARQFIRTNLDAGVKRKILSNQLPTRAEREAWQKCLAAKGWGAPSWPVEYGGTGWNVVQRHLFDEVLTEEGAPGYPVFGMTMLAPVLMRFGTQQQKDEILPAILSMDNFWCQGFSEPDAGSDLASLKARARLEGNEWVINGQKIWTTLAHEADKIFLLVRTSDAPKKQLGLSILLLDMDTPGVTVRPIITIDGHHEVNEVFFDDVRVSKDSMIGEEGKGWTYAKYLLGHERTSIARIGQSRRELGRLRATAAKVPWKGGTLAEAEHFRRRHAQIAIRHRVLEETTLRLLEKVAAGETSGAEANLLKIHGSEIQLDLAELWMDVVGAYSFAYAQAGVPAGAHLEQVAPWEADYVAGAYFNSRKVAIYGGSNEIQRNIIAKAELGL